MTARQEDREAYRSQRNTTTELKYCEREKEWPENLWRTIKCYTM